MPLLLRLLFDLANLALDLSSLTDAVTQIVELCTANTALTDNATVLHDRGMKRDYTLHAYETRRTVKVSPTPEPLRAITVPSNC